MAGGKLPPRQKMIGMMYLVLTALLAMNVSKDILNAFVTVNNGLEKTKHNFADKNNDQYGRFAASFAENKTKFGPGYTKAQQVKKEADALVEHIDDMKVKIIAGIEPSFTEDQLKGKNAAGEDTILNLKHVKVKDNYLFSTQMLVGSEPGTPKTGEFTALELKDKMLAYKNMLESVIPKDNAIVKSLEDTYTFEDKVSGGGNTENWPSYNFYGVPAAATITLLTKMQTDVRAFEADVVKYLFGSADELTYKFTGLAPAIIPNSNYVVKGDTFTAEVFLAAFDTTMSPNIYLGSAYDSINKKITGDDMMTVDVKQGKGFIKIPTNSLGIKTFKGVIDFKGPKGDIEHYPYDIQYQVAAPSTTISATKMNVFYIGVPNPVDIAASGVAKDKVSASISNGSISKSGEGWVVNVRKPGKAVVSVTAEVDGSRRTMGSMEFRAKKIPSPIAQIGGQSDGAMAKNKLAISGGIFAKMENFEFEVNVKVAQYVFSYVAGNGLTKRVKVNSNRFTPQITKVIKQIPSGANVTFTDIKAKMPDGEMRKLGSVVLKVL